MNSFTLGKCEEECERNICSGYSYLENFFGGGECSMTTDSDEDIDGRLLEQQNYVSWIKKSIYFIYFLYFSFNEI